MKEIIITYILSYVVTIVSAFIYTKIGQGNIDYFLSCPIFFIMIPFYIISIFILYYHNRIKEKHLRLNKYFPLVSFGISISVFLNMIIFKITDSSVDFNYPFMLYFISSGIVGPIYEEILFRYILFNRLKYKYSIKKSFIISLCIFSFMHFSPIKIIYAFILGGFITFIYHKENSILAPILVHMSANGIVLWLHYFQPDIFILSFINLVISSYLIFRQTKIS